MTKSAIAAIAAGVNSTVCFISAAFVYFSGAEGGFWFLIIGTIITIVNSLENP